MTIAQQAHGTTCARVETAKCRGWVHDERAARRSRSNSLAVSLQHDKAKTLLSSFAWSDLGVTLFTALLEWQVVAELGKEDGIDNISMGRQVEEQRTVAQVQYLCTVQQVLLAYCA